MSGPKQPQIATRVSPAMATVPANTAAQQPFALGPTASYADAPSGSRAGTTSLVPRATMGQAMMALRAAGMAGDAIIDLAQRARSTSSPPDRGLLASDAAIFAGQLHVANASLASLGTHPLLPSIADADLARIKAACGELFRLGRSSDAPQRETHIERVFDEERELRLLLSDPDIAENRAFNYYEQAEVAPAKSGATPAASDVASELTQPSAADSEPTDDRAALLKLIDNAPDAMSGQLMLAVDDAKTVIDEPSPPEGGILEFLLGVAKTFLLTAAGVLTGGVVDEVFALAKTSSGLAAEVGERVADGIKDAVTDTAKDVVKDSLKEAIGGGADESGASGAGELTPKNQFIATARSAAGHQIVAMSHRFALASNALRRLPTSTLKAIARQIDAKTRTLGRHYMQSIMDAWMNFVRELAERGPRKENRLQNFVDPQGTLIVRANVDASNASVTGLEIRGVTPQVKGQFAKERTIASVSIARSFDVITPTTMISFEVDAHGKLHVPERLGAEQRAFLDEYATPGIPRVAGGDASMLGIARLYGVLGGQPLTKLTESAHD